MTRRRSSLPFIAGAVLLLGLAAFVAAQFSGCQPASQTSQVSRLTTALPIRIEEIRQTAEDQPIRGWVAWVDLDDPRVEIRVTGPHEPKTDEPSRTEAYTETTPDWLRREGLVLAVNAHFFVRLDDGEDQVPPGIPVSLLGPCRSAGRIVAPGPDDGKASPVLAVTKRCRARIAMLTPRELDEMDAVVSGLPELDGKPGGLLVEHGKNVGNTALPRPTERHPRTAVGLSVDNHTLIFAVIDGRQPDWSIGVTLPELADILIELGATTAVNLDGGGSASFVFAPPGGEQVTNRPSDGRWRPVGTSLGVYIRR
ncbi:MAG: phosphodiester glycosidase family protein [Verrucomicrobia bacterium]|nr:phosphodiester glycosidase family protein [Verrucomicrobiota bacterium]